VKTGRFGSTIIDLYVVALRKQTLTTMFNARALRENLLPLLLAEAVILKIHSKWRMRQFFER